MERQEFGQGEEQLRRDCLTVLGPGTSERSERSMSFASGVMLLLKPWWQQKEDLAASWQGMEGESLSGLGE